jgi:tetratricopeptide (TPR) repeat protein
VETKQISSSLRDDASQALREGRAGLATRMARRSIVLLPSETDGYNLLANGLVRSGDPTNAARGFKAAVISAEHLNEAALTNLAMALELAGEHDKAISQYEVALAHFPEKTKTTAKLARLLFVAQKFDKCLDRLREIPNLSTEQLFMRGVARRETGAYGLALRDLQAALQQRPSFSEAQIALGTTLGRMGRRQEAVAILAPNVQAGALYGDVHYTLGRIYFDLNMLKEASDCFSASIRLGQKISESRRHLGLALYRLKQWKTALEHLHAAWQSFPNDYHLTDAIGESLIALNQHSEVEAFVERTLSDPPTSAANWNLLALLLKSVGKFEESINVFRQATARFPEQSKIWYNLGHLLNEQMLAEEAAIPLRRAVILHPNYPKAWNAYCVSNCMMHRYAEAWPAVQRALFLDRKLASAYHNRAVLERAFGKFTASVASVKHSIKLNPNDPPAQVNLAYTLLMAGELEAGFHQYETRWTNPSFPSPKRNFPQPIWKGEDLTHHTLLVYMEQGMGDEIMFSWYFPWLRKLASRVVVDCDPRLIELFKRSYPYFDFVPRRLDNSSDPLIAACSLQIAAGSIPQYFWFETREHLATIWQTATGPIHRTPAKLTVDRTQSKKWRDYLGRFPDNKLKVGVCWRSSVHNRARDMQYLSVKEIASCFDDRFVVLNLQYDHQEDETDSLSEEAGRRGYQFVTPEGINLRDDLDDLTALISELDIVVTPLISTAFMSGAVGTPTMVFRCSEAGRIWQQLGTPFMPWFPSIRLHFRRPTESWSNTIALMRERLKEIASTRL